MKEYFSPETSGSVTGIAAFIAIVSLSIERIWLIDGDKVAFILTLIFALLFLLANFVTDEGERRTKRLGRAAIGYALGGLLLMQCVFNGMDKGGAVQDAYKYHQEAVGIVPEPAGFKLPPRLPVFEPERRLIGGQWWIALDPSAKPVEIDGVTWARPRMVGKRR